MGDAEPDPTRNSTRPRARQHLHQRLGLKLDTRKDVLRTGGIVLAGFVGARIVLPLLGRGVRALLGRGGKPAPARPLEPRLSSPVLQRTQPTTNEDRWHVLDVSCPPVPSDYKEALSKELPCSVYQFYAAVLSGSSSFLEQQHIQIERQYNFETRGWRASPPSVASYAYSDDKSALQALSQSPLQFVLGSNPLPPGAPAFGRTVTFTQPKKPPATVDSQCVQRQEFAVFTGGQLVMATAMNMLNIPFKECFTVNTLWQVSPVTETTCSVRIFLKVHFLKGTLMGGIIRATTQRDMTNFYKKVFEEVQRLCAGGPAALGPAAPPARHGVPSTPTRSLWGGAASSVTPSSAAAGAGLGLDSGSTSKALAGTGGARRELMLAETMPLGRQMRVLLVFLLLLGSLVHQLAMHHDLAQLRSHMQHLALP